MLYPTDPPLLLLSHFVRPDPEPLQCLRQLQTYGFAVLAKAHPVLNQRDQQAGNSRSGPVQRVAERQSVLLCWI